MTFEDLCEEEPKLKALYEQVKVTRIDRGKSVELIWYHKIKPKMKYLVGFLAENEKLRTTEAYDLSYQTLYGLLLDRKRNNKGWTQKITAAERQKNF
jgi:F0F1-type ATP synthase delta subunit